MNRVNQPRVPYENPARQGVRRKVLVPLTLTFLVLISVFLVSGHRILLENSLSLLQQKQRGIELLYEELHKERANLLAAIIDMVSQDNTLRSSLETGNLEAARQTLQPFYNYISQRNAVSLLAIFNTEGDPFLILRDHRVTHSLQNHVLLNEAKRFKKAVHGVELGPDGNLLFSVAVPWYDQSELIGYLEIGGDFQGILTNMQEISRTHLLVTLNRSSLDENLLTHTLKKHQWDDLPERIPAVNVSGLDASTLLPLIFVDSTDKKSPKSKQIMFNNRNFRVMTSPFTDASHQEIGELIMLLDVTDSRRGTRNYFMLIAGLGITVCSFFFMFAFRTLGVMDERLTKARAQLHQQVDKAHRMNLQLESEILERSNAEQKLQRLNETLESRVTERTAALERLNLEIEHNRQELAEAYEDLKSKQATILHQDKMASVGVLAAGVAHDINNPIGFVSNNLDALEKYLQRFTDYIRCLEDVLDTSSEHNLSEKQKLKRKELKLDFIEEDLQILIAESQEGIDRVQAIVANLRSFSRVDDMEFRKVSLEECLESTINITRNEMKHKITLVRNYTEIPLVGCYPQQLNQVFMNLLINAAQAIEGKGTITINTWREKNWAFIAIEDTGSGIPTEIRDRIFDPFFTTKDVGKGTGLGLSIAYDIIKKHQGELAVESSPGLGTTFTIKLPLDLEP